MQKDRIFLMDEVLILGSSIWDHHDPSLKELSMELSMI
jgi:hypothetical protein